MKTFDFEFPELTVRNGGLPLSFTVSADRGELLATLLRIRALQSFDLRAKRYPVHRTVRAAVRRPLEELLDDLALCSTLTSQRIDATALLLDGSGAFISVSGTRKTDYSSLTFDIWATGLKELEAARSELLAVVGEQMLRQSMFTIDWYFTSSHMGLTNVPFDEIADPPLMDEAYPSLAEPVAAFIDRYIKARETVLILQGPPGTGKTRLVRAILAALSVRKGDSAKVIYTADKGALEKDELFVEFITSNHDAFVVEDADHLLMARSGGNIDLHRFLAIADGVVRAQGRKIIFTTNLPNISDIDEALVRPGRCFATVRTRALSRGEAEVLLNRLVVADATAIPVETRSITLAELYRLAGVQG
jgi:hypothetical protein